MRTDRQTDRQKQQLTIRVAIAHEPVYILFIFILLARAVASAKEARGHHFSAGGTTKSSAEGASVEAPQAPRGVGYVEMGHFVGILVVNFKVYSMNETVKIHQNPTDTSEYDAIKEANSKIGYHH